MKQPKVTVLMSVFNGEKYLKEAIESILNQSFSDFEFLIINDGSTDGTLKIISVYQDERIRLINNIDNIGLISSLNKGLEESKGEYIVRMDADDISLKNRLSIQVGFMDNHPNIGASGSYYYTFYKNKKNINDFPLSNAEIKAHLLFGSPIPHPAAILRKKTLDRNKLNYRMEFKYVEDYDLWSMLSKSCELANLKKPLLHYRVHDQQITLNTQKTEERMKAISVIRSRHLNELGLKPSEEEIFVHNLVGDGLKLSDTRTLEAAEAWLIKIIEANKKINLIEESYLNKIIFERWLRACINSLEGRKKLSYFIKSDLFSLLKMPNKIKIELMKQLYYSWKRKSAKK